MDTEEREKPTGSDTFALGNLILIFVLVVGFVWLKTNKYLIIGDNAITLIFDKERHEAMSTPAPVVKCGNEHDTPPEAPMCVDLWNSYKKSSDLECTKAQLSSTAENTIECKTPYVAVAVNANFAGCKDSLL